MAMWGGGYGCLSPEPAGLGVVGEAQRVYESICQDPTARKEQGQATDPGPWKQTSGWRLREEMDGLDQGPGGGGRREEWVGEFPGEDRQDVAHPCSAGVSFLEQCGLVAPSQPPASRDHKGLL